MTADSRKLNLSAFGAFRYDPFVDLDAARDPHLSEYLVVPHAAAIALKSVATAILAQPGGGKTALRIYIEQTQWDLSGIVFSATYLMREDRPLDEPPNHEANLLAVLAYESLAHIFAYPSRFLSAPVETRRELAALLVRHLAFDLDYILAAVLGTPERVLETLASFDNRVYLARGVTEPDGDGVRAICLELGSTDRADLTSRMTLDEALALVRRAFGAREVYILVDGIDNSTESKQDPARAASWIMPLLERAPAWEQSGVYLKAFLTSELEAPLTAGLAERGLSIPAPRLEWKESHLLDVIRSRISAATNNRFNSLFAISTLDLREIEMELIQKLPRGRRLPRELIVLTRLVLCHALRHAKPGQSAQIDRRAFASACDEYNRLRNWPG
jgi:hypothetical protein